MSLQTANSVFNLKEGKTMTPHIPRPDGITTRYHFICFVASVVLLFLAVLTVLLVPQAVPAAEWQATAGAQSNDLGKQALAFLPNELWVHVGDSITWTFATDEVHTVTFLKQDVIPQQTRPANTAGCPGGLAPDGRTANPSLFDGSACVNSGRQTSGSYTVSFPSAGNYKLVCLVHANMTAAVYVLDVTEHLPLDQHDYNSQGKRDGKDLLKDGERLGDRAKEAAEEDWRNDVVAGIGEIVANGGGSSTVSVMRFLRDSIEVRVGDTVEWTNLDPVTRHTITFGVEPDDANPPSSNVSVDADGARSATILSTSDSVNSGFIQASLQDRTGLAQAPLGVTRFRVTFNTPGVFNYICALHDELGMVGRVIVRPRRH
jgi:plastocyanin